MAAPEIPVYLVAGFLDSGKTTFINSILQDFTADTRTLLLCCEEGEEEYDKRLLGNVTVVTAESREELTPEFLAKQQKKARAEQVIVELNGMWQLQDFYTESVPANWLLYQVITVVQAPTFESYSRNMGSLMLEKLRTADMIIFNGCTDELKKSLRKRNLRLVNRRANIYLESGDGSSEDYMDGTVSAFPLEQEVIRIPDEDYGIWFIEIMDSPRMYEGKTVVFRAMMCKPPEYGDHFTPGRFAMVCCAQDMTFLAVSCTGYDVDTIPERTWVEITAVCRLEHWAPYGEEAGPVLHVTGIVPCDKPADEVVQM